MDQPLGSVLPLAIGVALSPVPIIAIVLMLGTPRARSNGPAFAIGWIAGLTIVGGVLLALASGNGREEDGGPSTWVSIATLVVGVAFVLLAAHTWRGRPRAREEAAVPRWLVAIDDFSVSRSLGAGFLLSGVNPKNVALTVAAAAAIAETGVSGAEEALRLALFVAVGSLSILAPVAVYFLLEARAAAILGGLKRWLAAYGAAIMTILLLVLGAKLIGDGLAGVS